jgi:hypothetical protein
MNEPRAVLTEQENTWVTEVAGRLRFLQADAALAGADQRREFFGEELARSLRPVAPADRKRYLDALLARFPVRGQVPANGIPTAAPVPAAAPAPPPETFEQLVERLVTAARAVGQEQRAQAGKRLTEAGLASMDTSAPVLDIPEELRQALGLPAEQLPKLQNAAKLCVLLLDAVQRLDQTALATLRELAPRSSLLKRPQDFRAVAAAYLVGEQPDLLEPYLRMITGLLGALLAGMLGGGRDFGRQFVERLSPMAIEDVVVGEGGGSSLFGKKKKELCWERYVLLSKEFETADLVERRMRDCLAGFVERKVLSAR